MVTLSQRYAISVMTLYTYMHVTRSIHSWLHMYAGLAFFTCRRSGNRFEEIQVRTAVAHCKHTDRWAGSASAGLTNHCLSTA